MASEGLLCGMPVHWATMADDRHAWVSRIEHLTSLQEQYSRANAAVSHEYIGDVLDRAEKILAAYSTARTPSIRMMMIDEYNVAWLEYLTRHLRN
jgi:hypothetical protein